MSLNSNFIYFFCDISSYTLSSRQYFTRTIFSYTCYISVFVWFFYCLVGTFFSLLAMTVNLKQNLDTAGVLNYCKVGLKIAKYIYCGKQPI